MDRPPTARPERKARRRKSGARQSPLPWVLAVGVLVVVIGLWAFNRNQYQASDADLSTLRQRTTDILIAMRDKQPPPAFNQSGDRQYFPASWTITKVEALGTKGHVITTIESANADGTTTRTFWELRFSNHPSSGWTCTAIFNAQDGVDAHGWKN